MRNFAAGFITAGTLIISTTTVANPPAAAPLDCDITTSAHHQQRVDEHRERIRQILLEKQRREGSHTTGMPELKLPQITTGPLSKEERINEHQEHIKWILEESNRRRNKAGFDTTSTTAPHLIDQPVSTFPPDSVSTISAHQQRIYDDLEHIRQIDDRKQQRAGQPTAMPELKMPRSHKRLPTPNNEAIANKELKRTSRIIDDANQRRRQKVELTSATAAQTMENLEQQLDTSVKQINRPSPSPLDLAGTESASHKRGPISTKQAVAEAMGLTSLKDTDRFEITVPPGGEVKVSTPQGIMKTKSASPDTTLVVRIKNAEKPVDKF